VTVTSCRYPENTPLTGYQYGCRCARCAEANRAYHRAWHHAHYVPRPPRQPVPVLERILARITVDPVRGCWLWPTVSGNGYGHITVAGRGTSPHRVMATHYHGPIPDGYEVDHLCHVRACCNPDHLDVVHKLENASRAWQWSRAVNSGLIVMDAALVRQCRAEHKRGVSIGQLAKRYNINRWTMKSAVSGRSWGRAA
jgi:hypothetical protein